MPPHPTPPPLPPPPPRGGLEPFVGTKFEPELEPFKPLEPFVGSKFEPLFKWHGVGGDGADFCKAADAVVGALCWIEEVRLIDSCWMEEGEALGDASRVRVPFGTIDVCKATDAGMAAQARERVVAQACACTGVFLMSEVPL